ncbi:MAG TPA: type II CAAX endopeptidase family protein [Gammaproteobacteria bacterium]|nr:type II CAAX endopeptidase family protein [Gammaproteobacteria bacterium]
MAMCFEGQVLKDNEMGEIAITSRRPGRVWSILQNPLSRIVLFAFALATMISAIGWLSSTAGIASRSAAGIGVAVLQIVATCAIYVGLVRWLEQRRVVEFGRHRAWGEFGAGFALGLALFGITMLVLYLSGLAAFEHAAAWPGLIYPLAGAIATAFFEEIAVRGVLFRIVEEHLGTWLALAFSAAAFGALHAGNPGATVTSSIAIALEAGVLLAAAYIYTRRLWLAIGLHAAWNFAEGGIFGADVSGIDSHGLLATRLSGPPLVSGGSFGPEASVVAVAVCLISAVVLLSLAWRQSRIVALRFPRPRAVSSDIA